MFPLAGLFGGSHSTSCKQKQFSFRILSINLLATSQEKLTCFGGGGLCWVLVLLCSTLCPFLFCNHPSGDERDGCFTFVVFRISFFCFRSLTLGASV